MSPLSSPPALDALRNYLGGFTSTTRKKGAVLFHTGSVGDPWEDEDIVTAEVLGSEPYTATLLWEHDFWTAECTCPVEFDCKHAYALGLAWLDLHSRSALSGKSQRPTARAVAKPAAARTSFRSQWTPHIEEKLGRTLKAEEGRLLDALEAIHHEMRNHFGSINRGMLHRHGLIPPSAQHADNYVEVFPGWWSRKNLPADPWALWQYLAYDFERHGHGADIPEVFRPMTDTAAVAAQLEAKLLEEQAAQWLRRLHAPAPPTAASAPAKPAFSAIRLRLDMTGWRLEVQAATGKPWKAPTQALLGRLANGQLEDLSHLTAPELRMLEIVALGLRRDYYFNRNRGALAAKIAHGVLARPEARPTICGPDGQPWPDTIAQVHWEAVVDEKDPRHLRFALCTENGTQIATHAFVDEDPAMRWVVSDGQVYAGPASLPDKSMPVALLRHPGIQERLKGLGVRLPAAVQVATKRVELRARLELALVDGPAKEPTHLAARLLAFAQEPPCSMIWGGRGWEWTANGQPPPRGREDPLLEFDRSAADAVGARFGDFRLYWSEWDEAWLRTVTRDFPETFVAWRASLPPNVEIAASPALAGLLGAPLQARIQLHATARPEVEGRDWFDVHLSVRVEDTTLTPHEIALLSKAKGKWVLLPKLGWQRLEFSTGGETRESLDRLGLQPEEILATGVTESHRLHALQLADSAAELLDERQAAALRARVRDLTAVTPEIPAGLKAGLRPYQTEGYTFLAFLSANGFGGVLADDMGLGKTVQTLAWMLHLAGRRQDDASSPRRLLVVCPKSVTHGWISEAAKFAPSLRMVAFAPALADKRVADLDADVVVANYTQLRLQAAWFASDTWLAAVLDEGQFIKNPSSQIAAAARSLRARHRVVLTGTPVENRTRDLWSLFAFAQPGLLGTPASFARQYPANDPAALGRLRRRTRHFLLRRTKAQVAPDLPPRTEDDLTVELEGTQAELYAAELKYARQQLLKVATPRELDRARFNILASLLRLRQICCHPALVDPAHKDLPSAKLEALMERLEELRDEGHQVLVFSQFVEMLALIQERLVAAKIGHLLLTGKTEDRAELVDTFQTDKSKTVFLLSLKAAGFGLNLTAASYAILYDPWWNPAVEAQAIDRTHRIGQSQPVTAYRLLARNSVEEKIRALQKEKASLAAAVVQEESLSSVLDLESLRQILA